MLKAILVGVGLLAWAPCAARAQSDQPLTPEEQKTLNRFKAIVAAEHPQHGEIRLAAANTTLSLGDRYYFLGREEAKQVITEGWGNPPDNGDGVLGIVFPKDAVFFDSWGAVVTYETTGHVSDADAKDADFGKLLQQVQAGEDDLNKERKKGGFPAMHVVGWAQAPTYDPVTHSEIWARQLHLEGQDLDALNYDTRILGRTGVLSLNLVSSMDRLAEARAAAADLAHTAAFSPGSRYEDFKQGDKAAGYGLAGLVAAGLGVAVAKKFGLLALILLFAKKGLVLLAAFGAWLAAKFRKLTGFGNKPKPAAAAPTILPRAEPAPEDTPTP